MNYKKTYEQLILQAQKRNLKRFPITDSRYIPIEQHHIQPRSLGGTDLACNLVNLLPREHYIAHHLLVYITKEKYGLDSPQYYAMLSAFRFMQTDRKHEKYITARLFEQVRSEFARIQSVRYQGSDNPAFDRKWMMNLKTGEVVYCKSTECEKYLAMGYIFQCPSKGQKMSEETRRKVSENHADVSGKNNPMYGHSCTEYMTPEEEASWRKHIAERDLSGENNGAYGKKWLRNIDTDEQIYVDAAQLDQYLSTGKWELGTSKSKHTKISATLRSKQTQMKNLQTRNPTVDFSEFNFAEYASLSKRRKWNYLHDYAQTHQKFTS